MAIGDGFGYNGIEYVTFVRLHFIKGLPRVSSDLSTLGSVVLVRRRRRSELTEEVKLGYSIQVGLEKEERGSIELGHRRERTFRILLNTLTLMLLFRMMGSGELNRCRMNQILSFNATVMRWRGDVQILTQC